MTKYELLDSKIMSKIDVHPTPFSSLYVRDVAEECVRIAKDENKPDVTNGAKLIHPSG